MTILSDDPDQESVLADVGQRLLITAPPGSGKTLTAVRLVARDVDAGRIGPTQRALVLTFSLQARAQLDRYATRLLAPDRRRRTEITNYHSWFWQKIRQFRSSLGLPAELDLATESEHHQDVLGAMVRAGQATAATTWDDKARLYARALEFEVEGCRPDTLSEPLPSCAAVGAQLVSAHRAGRFHYDDMAYYMWRLVDESATLRAIWRHKYPVVVLDEYQDASPIQARIIERLLGPESRVYAFADPLQMIYGWRDASPKRVTEYAGCGASTHTLRTLHRYRHRPRLQGWMQGVRDVLLGDSSATCPQLPAEVAVVRYDPSKRIRGEPFDTASQELWQLDQPVSDAFADAEINTIAVLIRKHAHLPRLEAHLSKHFFCRRLRTARDTAEWARDWLDSYPTATSDELKVLRLLDVAQRVAPRNEDFAALRNRVAAGGINVSRLGERRRDLGVRINQAMADCEDLASALHAAKTVAYLAASHEEPRRVASDAAHVIRTTMGVRSGLSDAEARDRVLHRISQLRFAVEGHERRGLYLLTCHEAKGKEFDMVVIPYLSAKVFGTDPESRQVLYVALTRARQRILVRTAAGEPPAFCRALHLT